MAINKEHIRAALLDFSAALSGKQRAQETYDVLFAILTPREREEIALRWQLVLLLAQGYSQRTVAAQLGISLCKITRGARELKMGTKGFHNAVDRALKNRQAVHKKAK